MTATFRSASGENILTDVTGHSCVLPAGATVGDWLWYWFTGNTHTITSFDANYPQRGAKQDSGGGATEMTCFGGLYTGTAPVVDINIADTPDGNLGVVAVQKSGGGTLTFDQIAQSIDASSGTSHAFDSITPSADGACVIACSGGAAVGGINISAWTNSFQERRDAEYWGHSFGATLDQVTAASIGTTATSNSNEQACKTIVSIIESGGGGGGGQPPRTMHQARLRRAYRPEVKRRASGLYVVTGGYDLREMMRKAA